MVKESISLALSGQGFLFPIHIGAIKALEEAGYSIDVLSGTSGGQIVSGLYKINKDISKLEQMTYETDFVKFMDFKSVRNIYTTIRTMNGFVSSSYLESFLKEYTDRKLFRDVPDLNVCATDLTNHEKKIFNSESTPFVPVYKAIMASCQIPFIYPVTYIDDLPYVDGGVTDNIPIDQLPNTGLRFAVQVLDKSKKKTDKNVDFIDVGQYTLATMLNRQEEVDLLLNPGTHIIKVSSRNYGILSTDQTKNDKKLLIRYGYEATKQYLKGLKAK